MTEPAAASAAVSARASRGARASTAFSVTNEIGGLLVQLLLVWVGASVVWGTDDEATSTVQLIVWCIIASLYLGATIVALNVLVRVDRPDPAAVRIIVGHPITRALSTIVTFGASAIGLVVALDLISELGLGTHEPIAEFSAVWAMLLSWAIFNWGFARIYYSRYHRAAEPTLVFPGTPEPRLVDFVYLAFTNATTFAVSDVQITSTRMRWTIVWHTSMAFFFNALIIVLTMNVIASGKLLADLFD
ncbi:DUF1345 domain-containing protein [Leucobacter musarum]|uniref:DUF1345 domain-containing protein n=1 Tax=Leucobacter musarum TaxID=1930747 RepID=UPI0006A77C61|nr:DUF1345 domain-containing protein [Leucobacter musarum]